MPAAVAPRSHAARTTAAGSTARAAGPRPPAAEHRLARGRRGSGVIRGAHTAGPAFTCAARSMNQPAGERYALAMALEDARYILLTTFRRDGTPVATPVWVVKLEGGAVGFWTSSGSGKVKRLAHTARVTVQPCDARGRIKAATTPVDATARLATAAEYAMIRERVVAKYGVMTKLTRLLATVVGTVRGKRIPYGDRGVVVTPASAI